MIHGILVDDDDDDGRCRCHLGQIVVLSDGTVQLYGPVTSGSSDVCLSLSRFHFCNVRHQTDPRTNPATTKTAAMNLLLQAPSQQQQEEGMALTDINPCEPSLHSLRYHASLLSPNQTNKPNTNNRRTFRRGRRIFSPILLLPLSFVVFFIFLISFIPMTSSFVRFTSIRSSLSQLEQQRQYQHQYQQHRPDLQATLAFHFAASLPSTTSTRRRMAATDATKDDSIQDKLTMTTTTTTKANNHSPLVLIRPLKVAFVTGNTMKVRENEREEREREAINNTTIPFVVVHVIEREKI